MKTTGLRLALILGILTPAPVAQVCPADAGVLEIGAGNAGSAGVPELRCEGAPVPGLPFALGVEGAASQSAGAIAVGVGSAPLLLPGLLEPILPALPWVTAPFLTDAGGAATGLFAMAPVPASLCGKSVVVQGAVLDPGVPALLSTTPAWSVAFGGPRAAGPFPNSKLPGAVALNSILAADLDGDGLPELIAGGGAPQPARVSPNLGAGEFGEPDEVAVTGSPTALATGDFDGDGLLDLAAASDFLSFPSWIGLNVALGVGGGALQPAGFLPLNGPPGDSEAITSLRAGDLDQDGVIDLVGRSVHGANVTVLLGLGNGAFLRDAAYGAGAYEEAYHFALADLDLDGNLDVVTTDASFTGPPTVWNFSLVALGGAGDGSFGPAQSTALSGFPTVTAVDDLDLDGLPDVAVGFLGNLTPLSVLSGNGTLLPGPAQPTPLQGGPQNDVLIADWNADGLPDLAAAVGPESGRTAVLLGQGGGLFSAPTTYDTGYEPWVLAAADFDGDALLDLAVGHRQDGDVRVLFGTGGGAFADSPPPLIPSPGFGPSPKITLTETLDLDLDGRHDVVLGDQPGALRRYLAGPGLSFTQTGGPILSSAARALEAADWNGDGIEDLAVGIVGAAPMPIRVLVYLGQGNGQLGSPLTLGVFATGSLPSAVLAADVDQDGDLDLGVADRFAREVWLWPGDGAGGFGGAGKWLVYDTPFSSPDLLDLAAGDFNGDGLADLAGAIDNHPQSGVNSGVSFLRGLGGGAFAPFQLVSTGVGVTSVATADFDLDGLDDLVAGTISGGLQPFAGTPFGAAPLAALTPPSQEIRAVLTGDWTGDCLPDAVGLYTGSVLLTSLHVFPGLGDGTLAAGHGYELPGTAAVAGGQGSAAAGDFDADGDLDAVVGVWDGGGFVVLENVLVAP